MKTYDKPQLNIESLVAEETIASVIPTIIDEEYETSIPGNFGDGYWD
jgi:hypothetical protein